MSLYLLLHPLNGFLLPPILQGCIKVKAPRKISANTHVGCFSWRPGKWRDGLKGGKVGGRVLEEGPFVKLGP